MLELDHIAVSGETLAEAQAFVEEALGVPLQEGGKHAVFHTHNALLGLEDGLYLEAIAIDPDAPKPDRPRWFALDAFAGTPRLTNWICRTAQLSDMLSKIDLTLGAPVALERGDLRWQMAVPASGQLPYQNCAPAVISWSHGVHPAERLTSRGVRLRRLTIRHPNAEALRTALSPHLWDDRLSFVVGDAGMEAEFETPHGLRRLEA